MTFSSPRPALLGLVLSLAAVACGDDSTGTGGGGSSSGDGGATSSTAGDGGSTSSTGDGGSTGTGDGGGGGTPVDPSTLPDSGGVGFYQFGPDAEVSAHFQRERQTDVEYEGGCDDWVELDSCAARRCYGDLVLSDIPWLEAGAMTTSGLLQSVSPTVDASGQYAWRGQGALFAPGDELTASFAGGEVPPFTATITAPPRITSLQPELEGLVIASGEDLDLSWTMDAAATVHVQLLGLGDGVFDAVLCEFEGDALAGSVPAELIPALGSMIAAAYTRAEEHVAVGSFDVAIQALDLSHSGTVSVE